VLTTLITDGFAEGPRLEPRTLDEVRSLQPWKTRLKVVIEHTHIDSEYIETYEGCLGNVIDDPRALSICIGGKGWAGEGRWVVLTDTGPLAHRKVSVFEVMA
jgi:hypothetical protein